MRRLRCAWAVLRGRPVAYRLHVRGGIDMGPEARGGAIVECEFDGGGTTDYAIRIMPGADDAGR